MRPIGSIYSTIYLMISDSEIINYLTNTSCTCPLTLNTVALQDVKLENGKLEIPPILYHAQ
jgi:hypothetical protein